MTAKRSTNYLAHNGRRIHAKKQEGQEKQMQINTILFEAGKLLSKRYYEQTNHTVKKRYHLLSEVDTEMNTFLTEKIEEAFPDHSIYSEESEAITKDRSKRWIIDPIDGTTNFITGNPYFAISIALEINNEIVEGHVFNPISNEYFFASIEDDSAYLNDKSIHPSTTEEIQDSIIAFGYSANMNVINEYYKHWKLAFDNCKKGIPWVAPALSICNVARGRVEAFIDTGGSLEGQAAASLILKKAGGRMFNNGFNPYCHQDRGGLFCSPSILESLRTAFVP